ncbi:MAG: hypothetical protein ACOCSE_02870, partial [Chitinivibrionales bacterium]
MKRIRDLTTGGENSSCVINSTGIIAAAAQCIFIRELFAVSGGNELITGIILGGWLLSASAGSRTGYSKLKISGFQSLVILSLLSFTGVIIIRLSTGILKTGESFHPLLILILILASTTPSAFFSGYTFGRLSSEAPGNRRLYTFENLGNLTGALCVVVLSLLNIPNSIILLSSLLLSLLIVRRTALFLITLLAIVFIISGLDMKSVKVKYPGIVEKILYIPEGEAAFIPQKGDSTVLINRKVYKSGVSKASVEQSVHIPFSLVRNRPENVLLIFDRGEKEEIAKYPDLSLDIIENKRFLADSGDIFLPPEEYSTDKTYDIICLSVPLPSNISSGRFFTKSFFLMLKDLMSEQGILSFTLPFSENYTSDHEEEMFRIIKRTLESVFENTAVFPGKGYTFLASDKASLNISELSYDDIKRETEMLAPYTL